MPPTTTYGKRSVKRKNTFEGRTDGFGETSTAAVVEERFNDDDELLLQPTRTDAPKKRRVESMQPWNKKRASPVEVSTEEEEDRGTPEPAAALNTKVKPLKTYGTPKKSTAPPRQPSPPVSRLGTPVKSTKAPTNLFPSSVVSPATPSRTNSPTKLAKRMLARSKTETSLESQSNLFVSPAKRTQSMTSIFSLDQTSTPIHSPSRPSLRTDTLLEISSTTAASSTSSASILPLPTPVLNSLGPSVSRTYAGRSRSYLVPLAPVGNGLGEEEEDEFSRESYTALRERWGVDQSEDDPYYDVDNTRRDDSASSQSPSPLKRTYSGKRNKSASNTPNASPTKGREKNKGIRPLPLPPGMMNPLKSITELRNKGESRRFLDEVAYLLDGMAKSQSAGLIRASAQEMVTKLCDTEFFRKAKAADVFTKVFDLLTSVGIGQGDKVLDTIFVFFIALISRDLPSLNELASHIPDPSPASSNGKGKGKAPTEGPPQPLVDTLFSVLDASYSSGSDPLFLVGPGTHGDAELRKAGLGKKEKITVRIWCLYVRFSNKLNLLVPLLQMTSILSTIKNKSGIFPTTTKITTSLLITHILQSLPPSLISQHHLPTLLHSLRESLQPLSAWSSQASWKLSLDRDVDFENVYGHLRLLDLYLLGQWAGDDREAQSQNSDGSVNAAVLVSARGDWLVRGLISLGIHAEIALKREKDGEGDEGGDYEGATKCLESVLRVLVSVTHGDEAWAKNVALENTWALRFLMRVVAKSGEEVESGRVKVEMRTGIKGEEEGVDGGEKEDGTEDGHGASQREKAKALDRLCLSLALLTNLVQALDEVKDLIRETYLDPSCKLRRGQCLDACSCPKVHNASALEILVQLYTRQPEMAPVKVEDEEEERLQIDADASFLRGHLGVLFGLCMQGSAANQTALLELLPGSQRKIKLNRLVEQARQFVAFFAVVAADGQGVPRESSSRVGTEIVRFLEELRDGSH
ncbi:hypothetical protein D9611_013911 [Ephemerocybe angulata]|uniref:Wings apart-like protein C-terminal domain-containing protein n=1 Tax=Ephemerocybe angulata TaxID=980116 RepID=A0A8H5EZK0_9AGAR|nr:hypothetical protein D9611_013911 [Tulosesus angulatus]